MKARKITGGKYKKQRKKKAYEKKQQTRVVKLAEKKTKTLKTRGGTKKIVQFSNNQANIIDEKGKSKKATIKNVLETPANRFLARQNILVKGAIIETDSGKARITNRPSQEGNIQAVLVPDQGLTQTFKNLSQSKLIRKRVNSTIWL